MWQERLPRAVEVEAAEVAQLARVARAVAGTVQLPVRGLPVRQTQAVEAEVPPRAPHSVAMVAVAS